MHKFALSFIVSAALLAAPVPVWAQFASQVGHADDGVSEAPSAADQDDSFMRGYPVSATEGVTTSSAKNVNSSHNLCAIVSTSGAAGLHLLPADLKVHLDQLRKNLTACQKNLSWLAYMGQANNQLGLYTEAAEYLERALMLHPDSLTVQLQYALALAGSGDALASIHLLRDLQAQPELSASLRTAVEREIAKWAHAPKAAQKHHYLYLVTRMGFDSNLLGAPNLTSLTLTLPGQSLQVPLDANYLRTAGAYIWVETGYGGEKGPWRWSASAGGRHSATAPAAALQQLQVSGEYAEHGRFASATVGTLHSRIGTRYRNLGMIAGLQWDGSQSTQVRPFSGAPVASSATESQSKFATGLDAGGQPCQTRIGPELQHRQIDSNPVLSGRYLGVLLQRSCQFQGGKSVVAGATDRADEGGGEILQAWQVSVRWGIDTPTNVPLASGSVGGEGPAAGASPVLRAGGRQQQGAVRIVALGRGLADRHQWLLDAEAFLQTDTLSYSPLLADGARRRLRRIALRGEYSLPLLRVPRWQLIAGIEWQHQSSNLVLFHQQSHGVYLALRRQW